MAEEKETQVVEEENPFIEPSLEEMLEGSEVVYDDTPEEKEEEVVEPETEEKTEEVVEPVVEENIEEKIEGLTDEKFNELAALYPELLEHKKYKDDYHNWEKSNRQKSQAIAFKLSHCFNG